MGVDGRQEIGHFVLLVQHVMRDDQASCGHPREDHDEVLMVVALPRVDEDEVELTLNRRNGLEGVSGHHRNDVRKPGPGDVGLVPTSELISRLLCAAALASSIYPSRYSRNA